MPQTNRLANYFKEEQVHAIAFSLDLVGRRFLILPWVLPALVAPSPRSCPVEVPNGTLMRPQSLSLGKRSTPDSQAESTPNPSAFVHFVIFCFPSVCVLCSGRRKQCCPQPVELYDGQQQGRRRLWLKDCSWDSDNGTNEQALGCLWCTPQKFAHVSWAWRAKIAISWEL